MEDLKIGCFYCTQNLGYSIQQCILLVDENRSWIEKNPVVLYSGNDRFFETA